MIAIGRPAIARLSNAGLGRLNDDLALTGGTLLYVATEARAHHDSAALAPVRRQALQFLVGFHHVDPRRTSLDDTFCLANAALIAGTCDQMKFVVTDGKVGRNPLQIP